MFSTNPVQPTQKCPFSQKEILEMQRKVNSQIDRWITNGSRKHSRKRGSHSSDDEDGNKAMNKKDGDDINATNRSNKETGSFGMGTDRER